VIRKRRYFDTHEVYTLLTVSAPQDIRVILPLDLFQFFTVGQIIRIRSFSGKLQGCCLSQVARVPSYRSRSTGFDSRRYQIFWGVVGLEQGPLSLVSTIEELLGRNSSGSGLENREYGRGDQLRLPRDTLYQQKLALISPTRGGCSVGIVRLQTKATEFI
jgi:hypothetical protein